MMGNRKQKWTAEEEAALLAGVAKLGPGKWKNILRDPEFAPSLVNRSNIDLKDKWRNLSVSGPSSKDKLQLPKVKDLCSAHKTVTHSSGAPSVLDDNSTADAGMNDTSNRLHDCKDSSTYALFLVSQVNFMYFSFDYPCKGLEMKTNDPML
ncbi:hypothetical protein SAY87_017092 [Trapa incisa]|uniref:MYB transcription factor n=1 Tax=Trapa incisa TaxID=236973 RepID=A0AAN7L7X6_9MYRT|nr:hypothetical protein SAY87_017092 [Trapa incisa]